MNPPYDTTLPTRDSYGTTVFLSCQCFPALFIAQSKICYDVYEVETMPTKREVKPALEEKPYTKHKVSGTVKPALNQKPYTKTSTTKRTVKRALAK
jgi:hypothetical protein